MMLHLSAAAYSRHYVPTKPRGTPTAIGLGVSPLLANMPNDPRFYETTFVMDSTKVTRTYADLLVYDYTKRGNNEGEKFWCLQAQVHDKA